MKKSVVRLLVAVMVMVSAVLAMGQSAEAKDMDSIGYLTSSGSTVLN